MSSNSSFYRTSYEHSPVQAPRASAGGELGPAGQRHCAGSSASNSKKVTEFRHAGCLVRLELIDDETGLLALGREWDELFDEHGKAHQCFQSHAWSRHWCTHYLNKHAGDASRLAIVAAWLDGELIFVCPLAEYRRGGLLHLRWLGAPVSQYGDVLMSDHTEAPNLLKAGFEFAARETGADLFDLRKVRQDSAAAPVLSEIGALTLNQDLACYMDLASSNDLEAYTQRYSSRSRKQRRRRRRRLAEIGKLAFICVEPGREASSDAVTTVRQKRESLRRSSAIAPALEETRFEQFFGDVATEPGQSMDCLVSLLCCGDDVIAREIGLQCKGGYLAHVAVYDDAYARFGPGVLQIEDMMAQCYARDLGTYDLLAPADDYKLSLADGAVEVCDHVHPLTLRGALYAHSVLRIARPLVRQVKDKAPVPFRRALREVLPRLRSLAARRAR